MLKDPRSKEQCSVRLQSCSPHHQFPLVAWREWGTWGHFSCKDSWEMADTLTAFMFSHSRTKRPNHNSPNSGPCTLLLQLSHVSKRSPTHLILLHVAFDFVLTVLPCELGEGSLGKRPGNSVLLTWGTPKPQEMHESPKLIDKICSVGQLWTLFYQL